MKLLSSLLALTTVLAVSTAYADDRIRELPYDEQRVVRIDACLGFQSMIEFAPDERIENVGVGDATQWLVVPNARADLLFVRPTLASTHSNMTVATSRRRYAFELRAAPTPACARGDVLYYLRFRYADVAPAPQSAPDAIQPTATTDHAAPAAQHNTAYTYSGARENVPQRIFDDGRSTYFRWADSTATPAVFAVSADGSETLASFVSRGEYLVVDQVAPRFVLRKGESVTTLFNDAFAAPALDAQSPQPRSRQRGCFLFFCRGARNDAD
jgi:type IV secretion system protein VirB9